MPTSYEQSEIWRKDPSNWKWGMFYFNREDKRILPPKRISWMGWTVNFANGYSVLVFAVILAVVLAVVYYLPKN